MWHASVAEIELKEGGSRMRVCVCVVLGIPIEEERNNEKAKVVAGRGRK